ncbi:alpha-ketoglutarate-dependent dioxygenase AlkB family protein [Ferrimonas balearica]|uniref:alpha-ketoglutarate-dependent dioxygenase AlkB family protein n=1 Tax=Ferrimonas balearica TaxID=44012 RepID=UPI001C991081|nr:alpha-ketoglutarate-dependent dioxygenase AlkB [Ferrimonas balearica]MBY5990593.1 alpha-ketoglutarate-dependent dioxygenase AlkB [Ferrimonas balearica]
MINAEQSITDDSGRVLARYWPQWLAPSESERLGPVLAALPWQQPQVRIFGRTHPIPRQQCYLGAPNCHYRYSGLLLAPEPVPPVIAALMTRLAPLGTEFNAVLVNRYRDGQDRMGWHKDDEPELDPQLAILSLGASRRLRLRFEPKDSRAVELAHGSLLWLAPGVYHSLPATARAKSERVSLTFRRVTPGFHLP